MTHINIFFYNRADQGVELTGWGSMTTFGNTTSKLQATTLIVEPQNACNNSYNLRSGHPKSIEIELVLPNLIQSNLLCAGSSVCTFMYCGNYIFIFHKQYSKKSLYSIYSLVRVPVLVIVEGH